MLVGRYALPSFPATNYRPNQKSHGVGMTNERVVLWFISDAGTVNHRSLGFAWNWDSFDFCSLWLESSEEHLPTSIAGVLRLRATEPPVTRIDPRGASLRMTAWWGGENFRSAVQKTRRDQKSHKLLPERRSGGIAVFFSSSHTPSSAPGACFPARSGFFPSLLSRVSYRYPANPLHSLLMEVRLSPRLHASGGPFKPSFGLSGRPRLGTLRFHL